MNTHTTKEGKSRDQMHSENNTGSPIPRQQGKGVFALVEAEASQVASERDALRGDYRGIIGKSPQIFHENFSSC